MSGVPTAAQSSYAGLGFGLTRRIAGFSVQASYETRGYYGRVFETWSYAAHDLSAAIGRPIDLSGPWSLAPRLAVGVRLSPDPTQNRTMIEATLPIIYQLSPEVAVFAVPRVAHQRFHDIPGGRSDTMLSFGIGLSVDLDERINVGLGVGYERRFSTLWSAEYARWILSPTASLRSRFEAQAALARRCDRGTFASVLDARIASVVLTLPTFGAAVRSWMTKVWNARRSGATHFRMKSTSPDIIQHSRTSGQARTLVLEGDQIGLRLALQADHREGEDVEAEFLLVEERAVALDDAGLLSARTRLRHGGAEMPTRRASSTLVMRPSSWSSARIFQSMLSRRDFMAGKDSESGSACGMRAASISAPGA